MKNPLYMRLEVGNCHISEAIEQAMSLSKTLNIMIVFDFNGKDVYVHPDSKQEAIEMEYSKRFK